MPKRFYPKTQLSWPDEPNDCRNGLATSAEKVGFAQPHPRPRHDLARHLRHLHHPLSTCCLASRWKEDMAFLRSFYVADDIWRFA